MSSEFDDLIQVHGHPVFTKFEDEIAQKAKNHAINEPGLYRSRVIKGKVPPRAIEGQTSAYP